MITISIIIPTLNRANSLQLTLGSIISQNTSFGAEVIVIDNGSTDETAQLCKNFVTKETFPFIYRRDEEPGLLTGRHLGASIAKGEILCFLDDDVELDENWLNHVHDAFDNSEVQLATGPSIPKYEVEPPAWLNYFWIDAEEGKFCQWLSLIDLGNKPLFTHPNYAWGLNFCIRKSALLALNGFNPDTMPTKYQMFQGDGETGLTIKAYKNNYKCLYHPRIKVHHHVSKERLTIEYFKKRAFFQGVCDSYTKLRSEYFGSEAGRTKWWSVLKNVVRSVRKILIQNPPDGMPEEIIKGLKDRLQIEERKGFEFHQKAYYSDNKVKEWVHKKDYWNYKIPR